MTRNSTAPAVVAMSAVALGVGLLVSCGPAAQNTPAPSPAPSPSVVASAPDKQQIREIVREWHSKGGDKVLVPLTVDIELAHQWDWQSDDIKRQQLTADVSKDVKAAMAYGPIRDDELQKDWSAFVLTMKSVSDHLQAGQYDAASAGFKDADKAYSKFNKRNDEVFVG